MFLKLLQNNLTGAASDEAVPTLSCVAAWRRVLKPCGLSLLGRRCQAATLERAESVVESPQPYLGWRVYAEKRG